MGASLIHALPGRMRVHVHDGLGGTEQYRVEKAIGDTWGVQSARMNALTGNILIHYDTALTDEHAVLSALQNAVNTVLPQIGAASCLISSRRMHGPAPDPSRVVMPVLHLVYSCSPIGVAMHVAELALAIGLSAGPIRIAVPILHLLWSCSPIGIALHVGELAWSVAPFLVLGRRQEPLLVAVVR